ncbi:cell division protein SepF [Salinicoccus sp. HZC-1]|uniref:cell division protein SepF n=1 Tax=Salinicoccus sp. HZC-1 TaxID=3385497 RepID=UPI00398B2D86
MAIKKFFKDIFVVEYEEEAPSETAETQAKQPQQNSKVTSLEQSAKRRPEPLKTNKPEESKQPKDEKKAQTNVAGGIRGPERRKSGAKRQEKEKKTIRNEKETTLMSAEANNTKVCLFEPRVFSETQDIADELKHERATLVNLSKVDHGPKKRIVDFLSGTVYALDGDIQKVGSDIFLCTPNSVGVEGEISGEKDQTDEF